LWSEKSAAEKARATLADKIVPRVVIDRVMKALAEVRAK